MATLMLLLFSAVSLLSPSSAYTWKDESDLRTKLLTGYDKLSRPYETVEISLRFVLFSLNSLDIASQQMSVTGILYASWYDPRLAWKASDSYLESLLIPFDSIWYPAIVIENTAKSTAFVGTDLKPSFRVMQSGHTIWMPLEVFDVTCEMKILKFPFDSQVCEIAVYAWAHDPSEVTLKHEEDVLSQYYQENGEWEYEGSTIGFQPKTDDAFTYMKLQIKLHFRRKWLFLGLSLVVPAILNSLLMCAVFALSFDSGEKLGYALTVLLTYIVLLTLVADSLPPVSTDISVLQIYLTGVMCVGTIATLLTVWTVSVYNMPESTPRPAWLMFFCRHILAPLACRTKPGCLDPRRRGKGSQLRRGKNSVQPESVGVQSLWTSNSETSTPDVHTTSTEASTSEAPRCASTIDDILQSQEELGMQPSSRSRPTSGSRSKTRVGDNHWKGTQVRGEPNTMGTAQSHEEIEMHTPPPGYSETDNMSSDRRPKSVPARRKPAETQQNSNIAHNGHSYLTVLGLDRQHQDERRKENFYNPNEGPENHEENGEYSWQEVAKLMDAVFLRLISFIIAAGSFSVILFYVISY